MAEKNILESPEKLDRFLADLAKQRAAEKGIPMKMALREIRDENRNLFSLKEALLQQEADRRIGKETRDWKGQILDNLDRRISELVSAVREEHPEFGYAQALRVAASDRPEVFREREQIWREMHG